MHIPAPTLHRLSAALAVAFALSTLGVAAHAQAPAAPAKAPTAKAAPVTNSKAAATPAGSTKPAAAAEPEMTPPPPIVTSGRHAPPAPSTPEKQAKIVERMTKEVQLTPDQQKRVNAVYDKQRAEIAAIKDKYAKDPDRKRKTHQRAQELDDAQEMGNARISGILTDAQMTKWLSVQDPRLEKYQQDIQKRLDNSKKPT